ncbi:MAG TPA: adenylate/guanylate cyclase domain-containing protein [Rhizomicrobium sp.]
MNVPTVAHARKLLRDKRFTSIFGLIAIAFLAAAGFVFLVGNFAALTNVDNFIHDWEFARLSHEQPSDDRVRIVAIDEETMRHFPYRSPINRGLLAQVLTRIDAGHPKAIGIDILFDQPTVPAEDAALKHVIDTIKTPLAIAYTEEPWNVTPAQLAYLRNFVPARDRVSPDLLKDPYGITRFVDPGQIVAGGHKMISMERKLAEVYGVKTVDKPVAIVWHKPPADQTYNYLEEQAWGMLNIPAVAWNFAVGPALFKDKIALVGSDLSLVDQHRTPLASVLKGATMPGVIAHAYGISTLLDGGVSPIAGWKTNLTLALILSFIGAALGILNFPLLPRIAGVVGILAAYWIVGVLFYFYADVMVGLIAPSLAMIASFAGMDSLTGREARKQRHFIQGAFAKYVSPKVVDSLVANPDKMSLAAERRVMTYIFTDIADFTTFSEKMDSTELTVLINEYLEGMTNVVLSHDGMVDKFIGDAVFAIFNTPVWDLTDHADRAVKCALDMDSFTEKFRVEQNAKGVNFGITRIGVLTGPAAVGNFGSKSRFSYTAQGDSVNAASRLEGLNKTFGTHICVSGDTRDQCKEAQFREIASVILKGKTVPTMVWEPLHPGRKSQEFVQRYREAFAKASAHDPAAKEMFAALAAEAPDDACVRWHAKRLEEGLSGTEIKMTEK